jgi:hypothetical protein
MALGRTLILIRLMDHALSRPRCRQTSELSYSRIELRSFWFILAIWAAGALYALLVRSPVPSCARPCNKQAAFTLTRGGAWGCGEVSLHESRNRLETQTLWAVAERRDGRFSGSDGTEPAQPETILGKPLIGSGKENSGPYGPLQPQMSNPCC